MVMTMMMKKGYFLRDGHGIDSLDYTDRHWWCLLIYKSSFVACYVRGFVFFFPFSFLFSHRLGLKKTNRSTMSRATFPKRRLKWESDEGVREDEGKGLSRRILLWDVV